MHVQLGQMTISRCRVANRTFPSRVTDHRSVITDYCSLISLSLLLLTLGSGCRLFTTAANVPSHAVRAVTPGKKDKPTVDPVDVQAKLLRFADQFSTRMIVGSSQLRRGTNDISAAEGLRWRISICTESCSIASGPNAIANLLDMTVFVTVMRASLEEHWLPKIYGESARPMLESCQNSETEIWQLAAEVINPEQQAELRDAIEKCRTQNPAPNNAVFAG